MRKCSYCEVAEATALKTEIEREWDDAKQDEVQAERVRPICQPCSEYWFDGTEDRPGTQPLA